MTPEQPSDATRFATRPKQRKAELTNATDNTLAGLRKETVGETLAVLDRVDFVARAVPRELALRVLEEGMWRQWVADDRTLDPDTVAEAFAATAEWLVDFDPAYEVRSLIREAGLSHG
jgi:hypothetical protein